jgi:peptidoglycan hydrolase-like protein with peptidoglycan-binding domain
MSVGSSGPCVKSMQESLLALPGWNGAFKADGLYGPRTRLAVVYYQGWAGLKQDGMAGRITLSNLNLDANRPVPRGRPATLPRMPDQDAVFSKNATNLSKQASMTTFDIYYTRGTTRWINDKLNSPATGLANSVVSGATCKAADLLSGLAGLSCDAIFAAQAYTISSVAQEAVRTGGCFKITVRNLGMGGSATSFSVSHSHNCIP